CCRWKWLTSRVQNTAVKSLKIEEFAEQALLLALRVTPVVLIVAALGWSLLPLAARRWWRGREGGAALDDFVQFAAVQPHSAAVGAVINFNTLAVGHYQVGGLAGGA